MLGSGVVGGALGGGGIEMRGGWAHQRPTEGGTDEVRKKEELRKGTCKSTATVISHLPKKQALKGNNVHTSISRADFIKKASMIC